MIITTKLKSKLSIVLDIALIILNTICHLLQNLKEINIHIIISLIINRRQSLI